LLAITGIAIYSFLNSHVPGILLFSYAFRWLNLFAGLFVVIVLVASIGRLQRQYAATDALTGILNRHSIYSVLAQEVARAARLKISFSIILFDIDNFKTINDTHGHTVGDQILVELSGLVGRSIRQIDVFGRWGGEEFLLVLPGVEIEGAKQMAERLCVIIGQHHFGMISHVTSSFGVAMFRDDRTLDGILHRADSSMYRAKRNGRNQVAVEIVDEVGGFE